MRKNSFITGILTVVFFGLVGGCLTGCGVLHVPKTAISGKIMGQPFELETPKDTSLEQLEITVTTNTVSIKIHALTAVMNPTNITATGNASAQLSAAQGAAFEQGINAGANVAAKILAAYMGNPTTALKTSTATNGAQ